MWANRAVVRLGPAQERGGTASLCAQVRWPGEGIRARHRAGKQPRPTVGIAGEPVISIPGQFLVSLGRSGPIRADTDFLRETVSDGKGRCLCCLVTGDCMTDGVSDGAGPDSRSSPSRCFCVVEGRLALAQLRALLDREASAGASCHGARCEGELQNGKRRHASLIANAHEAKGHT